MNFGQLHLFYYFGMRKKMHIFAGNVIQGHAKRYL